MKFNLKSLIDMNKTLKSIIDNENILIKASTKFRILGILKALEPHMVNFEIIRNEKVKEYGEKDQDGNYAIAIENHAAMESFNNDMKALLNETVSIAMNQILAEDIMVSGVTSSDLLCLDPILAGGE